MLYLHGSKYVHYFKQLEQMNFFKNITALALIALSAVAVNAQRKGTAYFLSENNQVFCDAGTIVLKVYIDIPATKPYTLYYSIDDPSDDKPAVQYDTPATNTLDDSHICEIKITDDPLKSSDGKHLHYEIKLTKLYSQQGLSEHSGNTVDLDETLTVDFWTTPTPSIVSEEKICGNKGIIEADAKWSDVSAYSWVIDDSEVAIDDADKSSCQLTLASIADHATKIKLTESTGNGKCAASIEKNLRFVVNPKATLAHLNDKGEESPVILCSSINDRAFNFDGVMTLTGHEPFNIELSNGQTFLDLPQGELTHELHVEKGGDVVISRMTDLNGCVVTTNMGEISGKITVIDRKPILTMPTDTIHFEGRKLEFSRELAYNWDASKWWVAKEYSDYDIPALHWWYDANRCKTSFTTNITGLIALKYLEFEQSDSVSYSNVYGVQLEERLPDCPSDTLTQYVDGVATINAPNGFSPNGDGRNDRFVLQSIPPQNHLMVLDSKGKMVFEKENYRNNWRAEDVEDGYYVYVFTGDGIKPVKETLVIKRSKK